MFGKQAYELLQEVANVPADNLPPFNVSGGPAGAQFSLRSLRQGFKHRQVPFHASTASTQPLHCIAGGFIPQRYR